VRTSAAPFDDLKKINVDDTALVSRPVELVASPPGDAVLEEDLPGQIAVKVNAPQRQLLVVSESYQDGWEVRVDGRPAVVERVNGDFFGCLVEAGEHRAEFRFSPRYARYGRRISLASLALALGIMVTAEFDRLWSRGFAAAVSGAHRGRRAAVSESKLGRRGRIVVLTFASLTGLLLSEVARVPESSIVPRMLKTGKPYLAA
jgi:hypothetical protein